MRTLLHAGNIPDSATAADLTSLFEQHGTVVATQIIVDPQSGRSLGFGFVEMAEGAEAAIQALHGTAFLGQTLTVYKERQYPDDYAHDQSPEMRKAVDELRARAESGDPDVARELADILYFPGPYYDPQAAYKWYYIALSQQGYTVDWHDENHDPPHYCGPVGDFRNECMVSDLVVTLGWERIRRGTVLDRETPRLSRAMSSKVDAMSGNNSLDPVWKRVSEVATAGLGKNAGMVVGVLQGGERHVEGYGANDAGLKPPDEHSVFEIGSVTKVFTTLLLADMVLRGEVALDDPARKYLPVTVQMPTWQGQEITLLHLATHTSSLPRLPKNLWKTIKDQANPYANYQVSDMYEFLSGYKLKRPISSREQYSNLGMGLLGHVLGLVAGKSYEELVDERVLRPLGLNDTSIALSPDQQGRLAPGHTCDGKVTTNWDTPTLPGCGALRSTVNDVLTFMAASMNPAMSPLAQAVRLCQRLYPKSAKRPWKAYAFAILLSGLSVLVQWQFGLVPGNAKFALAVFLPMLVAAWFGGLGPGLLATSTTVAGTYALQHDHNFGWPAGFLIGGATSLITSRRRGLRRGGDMLAWQFQQLDLFGRGPRMVWHNGGTGGYASFVGFTRETETAVVVLANSEKSVDSVGVDILKVLNQDL